MSLAFAYAHSGLNGTNTTVSLGTPAVAGDILVVLAVGGADGSGLNLPTITGVGASPVWSKVLDRDRGTTDHEFRATVWWTVCVGGETGVHGDWVTGANLGLEVLHITGAGTFNQVYLMVDGTGDFDGGSGHRVIAGGANPATNGEIYIGLTANGRDGYSLADLNINSGSYGSDTGDSFDVAGAVKGIMHHASPLTHVHTTADSVTYVTNDIQPLELAVLGVRVAAGPFNYIDSATAVLVGVVSDAERYTPPGVAIYDVNDASPMVYVRAGRENVLTIKTEDNQVTFKVQASPDGVTWYDLLNISPITVTTAAAQAVEIPPGVFYWRVKCTTAGDGPATCRIGTQGGY